MDFKFFEELSVEDAKLYLQQFLKEAGNGFEKMIPELTNDKIEVDYSISSLIPVILWFKSKLKTIPEKEDKSLPKWLRKDDTYKKGLYSFDEESKILILRVSYYFGECFVRNYEKLKWSIGHKKTAEQQMPVVTGFKIKRMELAPMLICENIMQSLIEDIKKEITSIDVWKSYIYPPRLAPPLRKDYARKNQVVK